MDAANWLPFLLGTATLLPLVSFFAILIFGTKMGRAGIGAGYVATAAMGLAGLLSFVALFVVWLPHHWPAPRHSPESSPHAAAVSTTLAVFRSSSEGTEPAGSGERHEGPGGHPAGKEEHPIEGPVSYAGEFNVPGLGTPWVLGQFGDLRLSISYYIDALTVCMFCMVTLIASLIHVYSTGYMHEELEEVADHEVTTEDGRHLHRPGRYPRFFQYLSLFSFSMLGVVLSGNVAMVFAFWELVGICSYFLIGFYVERRSASTAANKAFIVNRVGDFGMVVGMMALWASLGTFSFGDLEYAGADGRPQKHLGIFSLLREGTVVRPADGMVLFASKGKLAEETRKLAAGERPEVARQAAQSKVSQWRGEGLASGKRLGYGLLILAGVGIFAGCVGKSAQFPLHVWLPDAMEGPTPVSALVHSATMVAAGVYLTGRFYPAFAPEVLLVIAVIGCITLFLAATIALTATDIKRVLAYSTVSQLGYMMMALGVGAWLAGMMHLITHAFFKSLLFMCSGAVIHAVHTNDMTRMGGLLRKLPITALTMLVGCLAIAGAGIPFLMGFVGGEAWSGLGLSGFYSKDAILEQAYSFLRSNTSAWPGVFFLAGAAGAALTAFYMFRLWFMTFLGRPRDEHRHAHAHEAPPSMVVPLIILAVMAIGVAWDPGQGLLGAALATAVFLVWKLIRGLWAGSAQARWNWEWADLPLGLSVVVLAVSVLWSLTPLNTVVLRSLLLQAEPINAAAGATSPMLGWVWPSAHVIHEPANGMAIVVPVTLIAIGASLAGLILATLMYGLGRLDPDEVRRQFEPIYRFLRGKWWFDEVYDWLFVRPSLLIARCAAAIDRRWIDGIVDGSAWVVRVFSSIWDKIADQAVVDGLINLSASWTYAIGRAARKVQTGRVRQYVMSVVIAAVTIFILIALWNSTLAG